MHLKNFYVYGKDFVNYKANNKEESKTQLSFIRPVYLRNWKKFVSHPMLSVMFICYNTAKFAAGGMGLLAAKLGAKA